MERARPIDRRRMASWIDPFIETLARQGWATTTEAFTPAQIQALYREAQELDRVGAFRPAAIGHGAEQTLRRDIRGDRIYWLDPEHPTPAQEVYWQVVDQLRRRLNETLFLSLHDAEAHLAIYPPGSFYRRHLDQHRGRALRLITLVLYLNPDWRPEDGGQLRIYPDPEAPDEGIDLLPEGGLLVGFRSDTIPHEVLPARRARYSLTGWLRRFDPLALLR
ncbi:2OG-Fe(II) oxygenase [Rhodothermus marinus]|uniref:2OG-Fe(II) oxygenase n=1 Tax=Rhodothermus marinus (strain ATCC 43812 / DSM 4252 / R-10) TaxID=518766 RepID=D0MJ45_RHOM4|nr:2OG-Fe(II) oxygenase [Rhodothermus marinus]ACY48503.1 2OG-Fe(II) oxygenase [Rhodothermus marinus DSM 4252]